MRDIDRVKVLLQSRELADQRLQLVEYEQRLRSGFLSNQDRNYIRALHAWHVSRTGTEQAEPDPTETGADTAEVATIADLRARIVALEGELQRAHRQVRELEDLAAVRLARMNDLEHRIEQSHDGRDQGAAKAAQPTNASPTDDRFQQVRRKFAQLYHPDNNADDGIEKIIRAEIFKEFWKELEAIERG